MSDKKISRRDFIKTAIGSGILIATGSAFSSCNSIYRDASNGIKEISDNLINDLNAKYLRQIITSDSTNSRCIMWQCDDVLTNPIVEIRIKDSSDIKKFNAIDSSFSDDGHENHQYTAKVDNLEVGKNYEYRVVDNEHGSNWHELRTTDGRNYKILIFPDSQSADYNVWKKIAMDAFERNTDAEFFVNVGDIVDNGEDRTQWQAWINAVDTMIDKIPFVPVMGNHETYNEQWKIRLPLAYLNYFDVPDNGSEKFKRHYYSFDYGDVHFIVLDSQWDEANDVEAGAGESLIQEQQDWIRRDVTSSNKKWKVVFIHKDVLQYKINGRPERQEGISDIGIQFMPIFDELHIDIVFTAHLHTYRDRGHIYNFDHNPQGPLYILTGVAGDVRYPGLWINHALDEVIAPQPETDNYLTMKVDDNEINVRCFLPDGTEIDHAVVKKS